MSTFGYETESGGGLFFSRRLVYALLAYMLYVEVCDEECIPKKELHTHYEFRKEVGLFWLNPELMERDESNKNKRMFSPSM